MGPGTGRQVIGCSGAVVLSIGRMCALSAFGQKPRVYIDPGKNKGEEDYERRFGGRAGGAFLRCFFVCAPPKGARVLVG